MQYTYRCGICRTLSTHPSQAAAETERGEHSRLVHHGRRPEHESITPVGSSPHVMDGPLRAWFWRRFGERVERGYRIFIRVCVVITAAFIGAGLIYRIGELVLS